MKYYKRIADEYAGYKKGIIYQETYNSLYTTGTMSVAESVKYCPERWIRVSEQEYLDQEFVLPENWQIHLTKENWKIVKEWAGYTWLNSYDDRYISSNKTWSSFIMENYTEITFEQFQKHVLKTTKMDKKIIGYKLIKPEYKEIANKIIKEGCGADSSYLTDEAEFMSTSTINHSKASPYYLKKAGVLDLWFKPVYEEEFKVGDWVELKTKDTGNGVSGWKKSVIIQLLEIDENKKPTGNITENSHFMVKYEGSYYRTHKKWIIRKATPEEIQEATKPKYPEIIINGYKAEFFDDYVKFGCAEFDKYEFVLAYEFIQKVLQSKNYASSKTNREVNKVTIGEGTFTKKQIKEIAEYYGNR